MRDELGSAEADPVVSGLNEYAEHLERKIEHEKTFLCGDKMIEIPELYTKYRRCPEADFKNKLFLEI